MSQEVVVRRSALRVWLLALAAGPFWLFGFDLIFQQRLLARLAELIYPGDVPAFEARDSLWAWVFVLAGIGVTAWALKELVFPRKLVVGDETGVALAVAGPFRRAVRIPWDRVVEIRADRAADEGDILAVLSVTVEEPDLFPEQLWGARRAGGNTVLMLATDWDTPVDDVADRLTTLRPSPSVEGED
jgi:hypothetical protein